MERSELIDRGDIVVVALQGDSGKPRPAVIIQANWFNTLATVVALPLTSHLQDAAALRINVTPNEANGLRVLSYQRPCRLTAFVRQDRWYLIDFARGRPTNPARIPVDPSGHWYHRSQSIDRKRFA